ncbi:Uu.00g032280.m01.CDS01 [Anthostomella pinea]|uniref:Uu.00g032280.m01.CDS01 n=1 Tax=Anthostomella pinea TaxID=933095 RepID=A0AAI8V8N5_9PEZI|nr:Uu.00g032280.m01.CDS01 [Anthostomella pinea]
MCMIDKHLSQGLIFKIIRFLPIQERYVSFVKTEKEMAVRLAQHLRQRKKEHREDLAAQKKERQYLGRRFQSRQRIKDIGTFITDSLHATSGNLFQSKPRGEHQNPVTKNEDNNWKSLDTISAELSSFADLGTLFRKNRRHHGEKYIRSQLFGITVQNKGDLEPTYDKDDDEPMEVRKYFCYVNLTNKVASTNISLFLAPVAPLELWLCGRIDNCTKNARYGANDVSIVVCTIGPVDNFEMCIRSWLNNNPLELIFVTTDDKPMAASIVLFSVKEVNQGVQMIEGINAARGTPVATVEDHILWPDTSFEYIEATRPSPAGRRDDVHAELHPDREVCAPPYSSPKGSDSGGNGPKQRWACLRTASTWLR